MSSSTPENASDAFLKEVLLKMSSFSDDLKLFLTKDNLFSSKVAEELHSISMKVEQTITQLNIDLEGLGIGDRSPVLALLELPNIKCSLETLASRVFRQSMISYEPSGKDLEDAIYSAQHPTYPSEVPALPGDVDSITFNVFTGNFTNTTDSKGVKQTIWEKVTVTINFKIQVHKAVAIRSNDYSILSATEVAMEIANECQLPLSSCVLKAVGMNEYMYGDSPITEFLCIRESIRNHKPLDVEVIQLPPIDIQYVDHILELGRRIKRSFYERAGIESPQELVFETDTDSNWEEVLNTQSRLETSRTQTNTFLNQSDDSESDDFISKSRRETSRVGSRNVLQRENSISLRRSSIYIQKSGSLLDVNDPDHDHDHLYHRNSNNNNDDDDDDDEYDVGLRSTAYYRDFSDAMDDDQYDRGIKPLSAFGRLDDDDYELKQRRSSRSTDLHDTVNLFRKSTMGLQLMNQLDDDGDDDDDSEDSHPYRPNNSRLSTGPFGQPGADPYLWDDDRFKLLTQEGGSARTSMFTSPGAPTPVPVDISALPPRQRRRSSTLNPADMELNDSDQEDLNAFGITTIPTTTTATPTATTITPNTSSYPPQAVSSPTVVSDTSIKTGQTPKALDLSTISTISIAPAPVVVTPRNGGARPPPIPTTPKRSDSTSITPTANSNGDASQSGGASVPPTSTPPSQFKSLQPTSSKKLFKFSSVHSTEIASPTTTTASASSTSSLHSPSSSEPPVLNQQPSVSITSAPSTTTANTAMAPVEGQPQVAPAPSITTTTTTKPPPPPPPRRDSSGAPLSSSSSFPVPKSIPQSSSASHGSLGSTSMRSTPPVIPALPPDPGLPPPQPLPPPVPLNTGIKDTTRDYLFVPPVIKKVVDYDSGQDSLLCDNIPFTTDVQNPHLPPFKVRIHGLDGLVEQVVPRLGVYDVNKIFVATCLLSGDTIRYLGIASTDDADFSIAPRWEELVYTENESISYGSILRSAKIAFLVVGRCIDRDKTRDIPLAWCTQQVFDGNDNILTGRQSLELWPISTEDQVDLHARTLFLGASGFIQEEKQRSEASDGKSKASKERKRITSQLNPNLCKGVDLSLCSFLFRGTNSTNILLDNPCRLTVSFDYFGVRVVAPQIETNVLSSQQSSRIFEPSKIPAQLSKEDKKIYNNLTSQDALYILSEADKRVLWSVRDILPETPNMLSFFLQSCDFSKPEVRAEVYRLIERWEPPQNPAQIITLLDYNVADFRVRHYAVKQLESLSIGHLQLYMLQLTQCLKFEAYHNSPLARFLINKAIAHPYQIGHFFYWYLKNEMQCDPPFAERFKCILEAFLTYCPLATDQLRVQQQVVDRLQRVGLLVQEFKYSGATDSEQDEFHKTQFQSLNRDFFARIGKFQSPLDPRVEASELIPERCKVMSSKMAPLWLVFKNADPKGPNIYTMFKSGDDLRQDILTLQILRFMDEIWLKEGMDLRLSPYNVIATGMSEKFKGCGMIEVVLNSATTGGIQMQYGDGALGAFKEGTLATYIKDNNPCEKQHAIAVDNFIRSCAGYCVATYVLGIGDRHNGNIMVSKDGYLFHIDFGHFLGNFKSKLGINRERAAFVFTPEMAYVMGGKNYSSSNDFDKFRTLCNKAFLTLRKHAYELETLFITMVSAGMPELLNKDDINYLRTQLWLDVSEEHATDQFKSELKKAMSSTSRRIDNYLHLLKHSTKS